MRFRLLVVALAALVAVAGCKKKKDKEKDESVAADVAPAAPVEPVPAAPAGADAGAFSIPKTTFTPGEAIAVTYNRDMTAPPNQQHWITIARPTDPESAWGSWHYVKQSATTDTLVAPTAGTWEIRLHDVYPRNAAKVLGRRIITVQ